MQKKKKIQIHSLTSLSLVGSLGLSLVLLSLPWGRAAGVLGQAAPVPPVRTLLLGLQHLLVWPGPGCAAEQLGSAGGWSRRPREELLGRGQAPGWGHQEPPYGPCALPQQLSPSVTLGAQSPGADGREMGESGKICFVSTPRLKGRGVPVRAP